jgi:uncharacterized protein affecting Mg2+/Co2+ transport
MSSSLAKILLSTIKERYMKLAVNSMIKFKGPVVADHWGRGFFIDCSEFELLQSFVIASLRNSVISKTEYTVEEFNSLLEEKLRLHENEVDNSLVQKGFDLCRFLDKQLTLLTGSSTSISNDIKVDISTAYFVPPSPPGMQKKQLFPYRIRIQNLGEKKVQLLGRHLIFRNSQEEALTEVPRDSHGVVGEQPSLSAGDIFEYTSGYSFPYEISEDDPGMLGSMEGSYQMVTLDTDERFDALFSRTSFSTANKAVTLEDLSSEE